MRYTPGAAFSTASNAASGTASAPDPTRDAQGKLVRSAFKEQRVRKKPSLPVRELRIIDGYTREHHSSVHGTTAFSDAGWAEVRKLIFDEYNQTYDTVLAGEHQDICFAGIDPTYIFHATKQQTKRPWGPKETSLSESMAPLPAPPRRGEKFEDTVRNVLAVALGADGSVVSFILGKHDATDVYIDVICAQKEAGRILLQHFMDRMAGTSIRLSALNTVLAYYPRFGFRYRKTCQSPEVQVDSASVNAPASFWDELDYDSAPDDTRASMERFYDAKLYASQDAKSGRCKNRKMYNTFEKFANNPKCFEDGLSMALCR